MASRAREGPRGAVELDQKPGTILGGGGLLAGVTTSGVMMALRDGRYTPAVGIDGLLVLTGVRTLYGLAPAR